jgi:hypothetical protein
VSAYTILCGGCNRYKQECACRAAHPTTESSAQQPAARRRDRPVRSEYLPNMAGDRQYEVDCLKWDIATARQEAEELREEVRRYKYNPLGDNHHDAATCPHCGDPVRDLQRRLEEAKAWMRHRSSCAVNVCSVCGEPIDGDHTTFYHAATPKKCDCGL